MRASKLQFEEFGRSVAWLDIKKLLLLRRSDIRDALEDGVASNVDPNTEMRESARMRGRAEELKFITELPEFIVKTYDQLTEEEDDKNG